MALALINTTGILHSLPYLSLLQNRRAMRLRSEFMLNRIFPILVECPVVSSVLNEWLNMCTSLNQKRLEGYHACVRFSFWDIHCIVYKRKILGLTEFTRVSYGTSIYFSGPWLGMAYFNADAIIASRGKAWILTWKLNKWSKLEEMFHKSDPKIEWVDRARVQR